MDPQIDLLAYEVVYDDGTVGPIKTPPPSPKRTRTKSPEPKKKEAGSKKLKKRKTKKKYKKTAGTRKNIFNLLKNRELKGKQINEKQLSPEIIRELIKQTFIKHNRAQLDGDEDKKAILQRKLETLISNIRAEFNNEEELGEFLAIIEQEIEAENPSEPTQSHEPVFDDDNDSNEGHHSGRSSPTNASSKKIKKRKKRKHKKTKRKGKK